MASWDRIAEEAPEITTMALRFLEAHVHKTLATLRRDGSPRISGIEAKLIDGDLMFGAMPGSRKALDLRRDPRFALHSGSDNPPAWKGDAKLSGRALEITEKARRTALFRAMGAGEVSPDSHLFLADITELSVVRIDESGKRLRIDRWGEGEGTRSMTRA